MERIERIHYFIEKLKPEGQSGKFSPEDKDEAINFAMLDMFRDDIKRYDEDLDVKVRLQSLEVRKVYAAGEKVGDGYPIPSDIQKVTGTGGIYGGVEYEMDVLSEMEYRKRINDKLIPPIYKVPVCSVRSGSIIVSPGEVLPVLYYVKSPTSVKYNYTQQGSLGLDLVYNSTGSVHPFYPETLDFEVIKGACKYLGISLRDEMLTAAMEQLKK